MIKIRARGIGISVAVLFFSTLPPLPAADDGKSKTPGPLIVAGGGELPDRIFNRFVELAGADAAQILIIPQASNKADAGSKGTALFSSRPHQSISVLDLADHDEAIKSIDQSTGIWIPGGLQNRLMQRLREVNGIVEAIQQKHAAGTIIGGTSAGAAVMSDLMIAGTDLPLDRGLALWKEVVVDQHFSERKRMQRSLDTISKNPETVGVGIDESTAVLVHPEGRLEVIGDRGVTVIDARQAGIDDQRELPLAIENIRVHRHSEKSPAFRISPRRKLATADMPFAIVVHGGAGSVDKKWMTTEREKERSDVMEKAVDAGLAVLKSGGSSLDAVVAAIVVLEDSPLFNAGKGAVFTTAETNELDASIMDGRRLDAGAVGGVTRIKNPIRGARAVMEDTPHVMLAGDGADQFAEENGLEMVAPDYFHTERRLRSLRKKMEKEKADSSKPDQVQAPREAGSDDYLGTVGAVALDVNGNIAAGTSTGGMNGKQYGRIGDSPIIGAGTYAKNGVGGISCTGHGEFFIRHVVAYDIAARSEYSGMSLDAAATKVVEDILVEAGGRGGIIGIDPAGNVTMRMNTESMWRSWRDGSGQRGTGFYRIK